jgi:ATP phosphoribosyltransferase regulatory subunit
VRRAIANLDRIALETMPMAEELRDRALMLMDLRGKPEDVLQRVSALVFDKNQRNAVNNLKSLTELLQESLPNAGSIVLDLSLIRTFDYYTGIVFEVVSQTSIGQIVLGQGGRYDQLLGLYHPQGQELPGIGFSLQIEALHQVLLSTGQLPKQTPVSDWLVVSETPQTHAIAFLHAQKLRESGARVEVDLSETDHDIVRDYARQRRVAQIAWMQSDGSAIAEKIL